MKLLVHLKLHMWLTFVLDSTVLKFYEEIRKITGNK